MNNAKVVVEREDGAVFTCANSSGKGEYKVDMGELDPGSRYRYISRWMGWSMSRTIWDRR